MLITNPAYFEKLKKLKQSYENLPWYQRFWFSLWSYRLSSVLAATELNNTTSKQIQTLYAASNSAWFFQSIFGLLEQFKQAVKCISFIKEPPFTQLTEALSPEIGHNLTTKELVNLVQSSKTQKALFQPVLDVRKLLHHVTRGEYDELEKMLKKDITLLTKRGYVTDCSGRTFSHVSGFEYALWALDKHIWIRMMNCIPKDEQSNRIKASLMAQYNGIKTEGVIYTLNNQRITEQHFDFQNTIIKELQNQMDVSNAPNTTWDEISKQWQAGVGSAQKLLPMHVVHEYCSEVPFFHNPTPSFTTQPTLKKQFFNWVTGAEENWFHLDSKLSIDFAIYKGCWLQGVGVRGDCGSFTPGAIVIDLATIKALYEVRIKDFNDLESQLGCRPDDTPDVVPQM